MTLGLLLVLYGHQLPRLGYQLFFAYLFITALRQFFDFWYGQQEPIRLLIANRLDYLLEEELNLYFQERLGHLTDDFHLQFIVGGLRTWVAKGCQESPDEIMVLLKKE